MGRYIAVHTLHLSPEEFIANAKKNSEKMAKLPPGVKYNYTYCGFEDHKFFCDWESPNKETLRQVFKEVEMPYESIHLVRLFDVAKMKLES